MRHYTSFGYIEDEKPEYDSIERFSRIRNLRYELEAEEETTLDSYPTDIVRIPDGKPYLTSIIPYKIPGYIEKYKIYRNVREIIYGFGTNFLLINKKLPEEYLLRYLEEINRRHLNSYLTEGKLMGIFEDLIIDRNQLRPYKLEYRDRDGSIKSYGYRESKTEWINPKIMDKKSVWNNRMSINSGISNNDIVSNLPDKKITMKELAEKSAYSSEQTFRNSLTSDQKTIIKSHNKKYNKR